VHPDLFRTAGIPLIEGRFFDGTDIEDGPPVGVLSRAAANTLFPAGDAVGKFVSVGMEGAESRFAVIGIAGDVKSLGLDQESPATMYRPYSQVGSTIDRFGFRSRSVMLRTTGDPYAIAPQARQAVRSLDRNALIDDMESMTDVISGSLAKPRLIMLLISLFTGTALILGAIGVYGVIAYAVRERTKEISIRVALGASRRHVLGGVLLNGLRMAATGTILGVALAVLVLKVLENFLFEVATLDPVVLGAAAALSMVIALLASFIPARRAVLIDPVDALSAN
jgi:ABC-type antimicrobial peptide transport system permease subunit